MKNKNIMKRKKARAYDFAEKFINSNLDKWLLRAAIWLGVALIFSWFVKGLSWWVFDNFIY